MIQHVDFKSRFPKNRNVAAEWNAALGIDRNKILHGFVCFEHFEEDRFEVKNKSKLKADAIPTIFDSIKPIEPMPAVASTSTSSTSDTVAENQIVSEVVDEMETMLIPNCSSNEIVATVTTNSPSHPSSQCQACSKKDHLLREQDYLIKELRKKLKKANTKIWYLENTKLKLKTAFSEMKREQLVTAELCQALEV